MFKTFFIQDVVNVVNVIKRYWGNLNQDTKNIFWKHMQLMILLL